MDDQFLIIQDTIDDNKQASDEKMNTYDSKLDKTMNHNKNSNYSSDRMDLSKSHDPTTMLPANKEAPILGCRNSKKYGGMWTLLFESPHTTFF